MASMQLFGPKSNVGAWAFVGGVLLAFISAMFAHPIISILVFASAVLVGLSNINKKEEQSFLLAIIGVGVIGFVAFSNGVALIPLGGEFLAAAVSNIGGFLTAAAATWLFFFMLDKLKK
jgi:uncharacterized membrane protein